jgi:hypothetical protein
VEITSGNLLTQYVAERDIPAVGSGSPVAALDLAQQLVLGRRCNYLLETGTTTYFSLAGHDVGFNDRSEVAYGVNADDIYLAGSFATRNPYTKESFVGAGYAERSGALYCTEGYGSTFPLVTKRKIAVMYELLMEDRQVHTMRWDSGPDNSNTGTGKSMRVVIDSTAQTIDLYAWYREAGLVTKPILNIDWTLGTTLDWSLPFRVIVTQEWTTKTNLNIDFAISQVDSTGTVRVWNSVSSSLSKDFNTPMDVWSRPWVLQGGAFRNLVIADDVSGFTIANLNTGVDITPATSHYDMTSLEDAGLTSYPIAGMVGSVWDYIKQVAGGSGFEFHADRGNIIRIVMAGEDVQELPNYIGPITRSVSDEGAAQMLVFKNYGTDLPDFRYKPNSWEDFGTPIPLGSGSFIVYDAQLAGETWSIGINEVQDVVLNVPHFPSIVQNPKPASRNQGQTYVS